MSLFSGSKKEEISGDGTIESPFGYYYDRRIIINMNYNNPYVLTQKSSYGLSSGQSYDARTPAKKLYDYMCENYHTNSGVKYVIVEIDGIYYFLRKYKCKDTDTDTDIQEFSSSGADKFGAFKKRYFYSIFPKEINKNITDCKKITIVAENEPTGTGGGRRRHRATRRRRRVRKSRKTRSR